MSWTELENPSRRGGHAGRRPVSKRALRITRAHTICRGALQGRHPPRGGQPRVLSDDGPIRQAEGHSGYFGTAAGAEKYYYSYPLGDWTAVVLNTGDIEWTNRADGLQTRYDCFPVSCQAGSPQETWLRETLADIPPNRCVVAYWHHPRYASGSERTLRDRAALRRALRRRGRPAAHRAHALLRALPADERRRRTPAGGVRQIIVGTGGKPRSQTPPQRHSAEGVLPPRAEGFGALEVKLFLNGYEFRFVREDGSVRDQGSAPCHTVSLVSDRLTLPWLDEPARARARPRAVRRAHPHRRATTRTVPLLRARELTEALALGDARAAVFPMHEPDGYPAANDMVLAEARRLGRPPRGVLPARPRGRAAARGRALPGRRRARHQAAPARRAASRLDHPALRDVFALADERRLPVICHAGRGIPALGRHAVDLCGRVPGGAADPRPRRHLRPGLDLARRRRAARTSSSTPRGGLPATCSRCSRTCRPGQVLFGSDAPYAHARLRGLHRAALRPPGRPRRTSRSARVVGGQLERLLAREEPLDLGPAPGAGRIDADPLLDRALHVPRERDRPGAARRRARGVAGAGGAGLRGRRRRAAGAGVPLDPGAARGARDASTPKRDGRPPRFAPGLHLIVMAACLARTPDVPLPPDPRARRRRRARGARADRSFAPGSGSRELGCRSYSADLRGTPSRDGGPF